MGWTSYNANFYKKNGKVDIVAEVENYFNENEGYKVLKSSAVGRVVYSAVERFKDEEKIVFASIFLTSVDNGDYYNFSYKDMDETVGPCYYDCPASILKLLTPTESEYANEWREACWKKIEEKKKKRKDPNSLSNLPVGSKIEMKYWGEGNPIIVLEKMNYWGYKRPIWVCSAMNTRFKEKDIQSQGYKVL